MLFPWHGWYGILTLDKPFEVSEEANLFVGYDVDELSDSVSEALCTSLTREVEGKETS
jgi:hypothetical protein